MPVLFEKEKDIIVNNLLPTNTMKWRTLESVLEKVLREAAAFSLHTFIVRQAEDQRYGPPLDAHVFGSSTICRVLSLIQT